MHDAHNLAAKFKRNDWNGVLAKHLFSRKALASLQSLIKQYGSEAVDDAVTEYIARSKTDRAINGGHVRNWLYFVPVIVQQDSCILDRV